ncbi:hypothetical protein J0A67_04620 [Algoriphagus aestuariicola]|uniref:Uncharacterized protein n=1 Tax=Algoriphagus aestuariicola TaxID=1852016 RepID=A0ABS3BMI1_9BACT|nr:hypothetical protein [Algoriphagus aestuariicola]MBN7800131.1 hypothetical protein [Algoriphagus aestuariicola]
MEVNRCCTACPDFFGKTGEVLMLIKSEICGSISRYSVLCKFCFDVEQLGSGHDLQADHCSSSLSMWKPVPMSAAISGRAGVG